MKRILQATMAAITVAMTSITTTPSKADSHFSYRTLITDAGRSLSTDGKWIVTCGLPTRENPLIDILASQHELPPTVRTATGHMLIKRLHQPHPDGGLSTEMWIFTPALGESHAAAQYFEIRDEDYQRWPEGRRRVVQAIYGTKESFRKRTIALVKTLDTEDWELIERTASYVVVPSALLSRNGFGGTLSFDELDFHEAVELRAMGIVGSPGVLGAMRTFKPSTQDRLYKAIRFGDHALIMHFRNAEQSVDWPVTPITKVGQELLPLLQRAPNLVTPEWNYMRALGEGLAKEGVGVELWEVSDGRKANEMKREKQIWTIAATK